jgi:hypothetical protein
MRRIVVALVLVWAPLSHADSASTESGSLVAERSVGFPARWTVAFWAGAPAGTGVAISRRLGQSWQIRTVFGTSLPITGVGANLGLVRGTRLGPITLWYGAEAVTYRSDNCSWGGCGKQMKYDGAGPMVGVQLALPSHKRLKFVADLGFGVARAFYRTDNLARYQPLGGLRLGLGW